MKTCRNCKRELGAELVTLCPKHAAIDELIAAVKEMRIRITDLFDRHERPTYITDTEAECDFQLTIASATAALKSAGALSKGMTDGEKWQKENGVF